MPRCNKHDKYYPDQMDRCEHCQAELVLLQTAEEPGAVVTEDDLRHNETLAATILAGFVRSPQLSEVPTPGMLAECLYIVKSAAMLVSERYAVEVATAKQGT